MKLYSKFAALAAIIFLMASCQDLDKLNEDPNRVKEADPSLLLTPIAKNVFSMKGIDKEYASRMIIQTDGENSYQYFKWNSSNFDRYSDLMQIQKMMDEAERANQEEYLALGHFLKAQLFYELTMTFGDIPFSEALQGEGEIRFPKYDSQEQVFEGIIKELDLAASLVKTEATVKGDIVYNGDLTKWKKLINSYQLKVLMSLSKKSQAGDFSVADKFNSVYNAGNLIEGNAENGEIIFYDQAGSRYPRFNESAYGSGMYMSGTFIDLLKELKDPRLFVFAQQTATALENGLDESDFEGYNGGNPIVPYAENEKLVQGKNISKIKSRYYMDPTAEPNFILSYSELQFILAEAVTRGWISGDAEEFYNNAIKASFDFYATYAKGMANYFTAESFENYMGQNTVKFSEGDTEAKLKQILTQKYITMFHQGGWTIYYDHLRTGFPEFKTQSGVTPPTRWIYPTSEYNRNQENLQNALNSQFGGEDNIRSIAWWLK